MKLATKRRRQRGEIGKPIQEEEKWADTKQKESSVSGFGDRIGKAKTIQFGAACLNWLGVARLPHWANERSTEDVADDDVVHNVN